MNPAPRLFSPARTLAPTLIVAFALAGVVVFWLWRDFIQERATQQEVVEVRGQSVLAALEGGIRSHHRLGNWFTTNVNVVLDETASAAGTRGLGIFKEDGSLFAKGGAFPDSLHPDLQPQWLEDGILICLKAKIESPGGGGPNPMRRKGWGRGAEETARPAESPDLDDLLKNPVWLAVYLDAGDYHHAMGKAWFRFLVSLGATLLSIAVGVLAVSLIQRQGRMAAELGLAREREMRLSEMALLGAGLAHETKNPLGLIRGLAQSLMRRAGGGETESSKDARQIVDEVDRVVSRINAFLTYARPKSPTLQDIDLATIVEETASLFRDEARAKGVDLEARTESSRAQADPDQVRQVLVNLLANALAACAKGNRIEATVGRGSDGKLALSIRDTGEGIAAEDLPSIGTPYFTRREGGTGLGLAIVRQIADAHGWRLEIESKAGEGSLFRIRI